MDALLALGLLLTMASQFRLGGLPIGPGEMCLVIWVLLALVREVARLGPPLTIPLSRMLIFWALFAFAETLGTLTALAIQDVHDPVWFLHDVMAYPLVAAVSCLSVAGLDAGARLHRVGWILLALGAALLTPQLAGAWGLVDLPIIDPWFGDRFRGWSNNPNQLALLCAVLVLLALHLADTATRRGEWIGAVACAIPPLFIGRATKTDTFTFALMAAGPVFLAIKMRVWLVSRERKMMLRPRVALLAVTTAPLLLASLVPFGLSAVADSQSLAMGLMKNGGKEAAAEADTRLELWREAISRGIEAGMLGLGPGPHLPIPSSIVTARQTEPGLDTGDHPTPNGMPNFEAHNTPLDLFTQGGVIAVLGFVWLMATAFAVSYRARVAGLTALLCGLGVFSLTNLVVRVPIFWFVVALCLVAEARIGPTPAAPRSRPLALR
ncbi:O-antigen ligase family protein [Limobrevibacterium gyesilva]|uniref:Uncharacterized protein n=1 Tax=Limobrevibacterium gyesilva TaxID=2991712 RepID=A0AA41YM90_9PROT|nr:hypothetical protein [Limobrevibacterium gyesilva]MCW3476489.1 hypothetical protein [Limobrevibacterium gyesilva]